MTFWRMIDETQQPAREETEVRASGVAEPLVVQRPIRRHRLLAPRREPSEDQAMTDTELIDFLADPRQNIANVTLPEDIVRANIHSLRDALKEAARRWRESHD
jgi:hypothetical protein